MISSRDSGDRDQRKSDRSYNQTVELTKQLRLAKKNSDQGSGEKRVGSRECILADSPFPNPAELNQNQAEYRGKQANAEADMEQLSTRSEVNHRRPYKVELLFNSKRPEVSESRKRMSACCLKIVSGVRPEPKLIFD